MGHDSQPVPFFDTRPDEAPGQLIAPIFEPAVGQANFVENDGVAIGMALGVAADHVINGKILN